MVITRLLPPFLQCAILLYSVPSVSVYSLRSLLLMRSSQRPPCTAHSAFHSPGIGSGIVIFVGAHKPWSDELTEAVDRFCAEHDSVVFCDIASKFYGKYAFPLNLLLYITNKLIIAHD